MPAVTAADKSALFAQYQILEELGDFPNFSLYKVRAPNGAIKLWKKVDLQYNSGGIETRLLPVIERVHHPFLNAVSNSFHFPDKGLLFVESEFPAKTLRHRLAECKAGGGQGGIPSSELFSYMAQAAEAIDFLNTAQHNYNGRRIAIYHRAVSPDSLQLFEEKGRVVCKVGDFGLAKPIVDTNDSARHSLGLTNFDYSPPEYDDGMIANTSDQFALATTYCELKTGKLPFTGSLLQKLQAQLSGTPDLALLEANERPALTRALSREPTARFPTCKEFVAQLQAALGGVSTFAVASSRVLGKAANGQAAENSSGWGAVKPVGKSGGALFDVGFKAPSNKPASKPDGASLLGSVTVGAPSRGENRLTTAEKEARPRKEKAFDIQVPKEPKPSLEQRAVPLPEPKSSPMERPAARKQPDEPRKAAPAVPDVPDHVSLSDPRWTPGQVTAGSKPAPAAPSTPVPADPPSVKMDPKTAPPRAVISDKAKNTLEMLKKRHNHASTPGVVPGSVAGFDKPAANGSNFTGHYDAGHEAAAPMAMPYADPLPPRRASTDHIGGDRLPFRPPPIPVPRRSSSPSAPAAANVTPFQALRTNVPTEKPEGNPLLTMFLVGFSAFCLALLAIAYFNAK